MDGIAGFFGHASGKNPYESTGSCEARLVVVRQHSETTSPGACPRKFAMTALAAQLRIVICSATTLPTMVLGLLADLDHNAKHTTGISLREERGWLGVAGWWNKPCQGHGERESCAWREWTMTADLTGAQTQSAQPQMVESKSCSPRLAKPL